MRKRLFKPVVGVAILSVVLLGCAGSGKVSDSDTTTMSETQTMAGNAPETEADIDYDAMFGDVESTRQFDILALANSNEHLTTFVELVERADISRVLKAEGPYTVFIPTNNAFNSMTEAELNDLLKPENKVALLKVLQAHIIPTKVYITDFKDAQRIKTADNKVINVRVEPNNNVTIGGARIVKPNVEVSNGVVHIVDGVVTAQQADGGLIDR
ncbi:fasciclin domain-containing protein [Pontibacter sp. H259]|uniref:fasciclin domain-containing protein n=1 Tax=Pontibacter sp. H259 TaxID=3133421 RepID=UPI0030C3E2E2